MGLVVTTTSHPDEAQRTRARRVAARCDVPSVPRRGSLASVLAAEGAELAYVVGREHDALERPGERLFVHEGLLHARLRAGRTHPMIRAIAGQRQVRRVVDGTLGLAQDALHVAAALGCEVLGIEASRALISLCEEGLGRLARRGVAGATRIDPVLGRTEGVLRGQAGDSADVVVLSPMFETPRLAPPGWDLLRRVAAHDPLSDEAVDEALRVAPRLVVKVPRDAEPPLALGPCARIRGRAVDYLVRER